MSPYRTQLNKTGIPGQVHTASESPLYPLLSLFFFSGQPRKPAGRQPELTPATINSPFHSYLITTKNCNFLPDNSTAARCTNASGHWPSQRGTQLRNTTTLIHTVWDPHIGPWPVTEAALLLTHPPTLPSGCSNTWPSLSPQHFELTSFPVPVIFRWCNQRPHLDKAPWQLLQETLALGGTLAVLLPLITSSFFLVKWTVNSFTPEGCPTTAVLVPVFNLPSLPLSLTSLCFPFNLSEPEFYI